jgi:hypothetical protein
MLDKYTMTPVTEDKEYVIKFGYEDIATINFSNWKKEKSYWYISTYKECKILLPFESHCKFNTKEEAYNFVTYTHATVKHHIETSPLPEVAQRYFTDRARALSEETAAHISALHNLQNQKYQLLKLIKQFGVEHAAFYIDDSDLGKAVKNLLEFKVYHKSSEGESKEINFFSEVVLYDLVGKEDARTILVLLKKLIKIINPESSLRF